MNAPSGWGQRPEPVTCATCGVKLFQSTRQWDIMSDKDYCREHQPNRLQSPDRVSHTEASKS